MIHNEHRTLKNSILWEMEQFLRFQDKTYAERSGSMEPKTDTINRILDFYMQTKDFYKHVVSYADKEETDVGSFEGWLKENCKYPHVINWKEHTVCFTDSDDAIHFKLRYGKAQ